METNPIQPEPLFAVVISTTGATRFLGKLTANSSLGEVGPAQSYSWPRAIALTLAEKHHGSLATPPAWNPKAKRYDWAPVANGGAA